MSLERKASALRLPAEPRMPQWWQRAALGLIALLLGFVVGILSAGGGNLSAQTPGVNAATLSDLRLIDAIDQPVHIHEEFQPERLSYTVTVPSRVETLTVVATPSDSNATMVIQDDEDAATPQRARWSLTGTGLHTRTITVTSGGETNTYQIALTRLGTPGAPSDCPTDQVWCATLLALEHTKYHVGESILHDYGYAYAFLAWGDISSDEFAIGSSDYLVFKVANILVTDQSEQNVSLNKLEILVDQSLPPGSTFTIGGSQGASFAVGLEHITSSGLYAWDLKSMGVDLGWLDAHRNGNRHSTTISLFSTSTERGDDDDDATLQSLSLSGVALRPAFSPGVTSYTASVADTVSSTTVTAATTQTGATAVVLLNGVVDGDGTVDLAEGANTITVEVTVEVTAEDGTSMQTYTVTVTRGAVGPPVITGVGGGGGGGGGPSGPSPSEVDFEWTVKHDIEELDASHDKPTGMWPNGTTLWLAENGDGADDAIYAYDLDSGERVADREFELDQTNRAPRGVWSDRSTIWVSDSGQNQLFAHDLASGERLSDSDIELAERNADPRGIWSDEVTMWVLDGIKDSLFAYNLETGDLLGEYPLGSRNSDPQGIWSDRVTIWISDAGASPRSLFAYRLPVPAEEQGEEDEDRELERVRDEDFTELSNASNNSPRGIWSDGDVMYVVDASDGKVYTYNMPDAIDARLASLTLSGVDFGEFDGGRTEYEGVPGEGVAETTVEATTVQRRTEVGIHPTDADGNEANGHQVSLQGVSAIAVTVTSADGSRTRVYRVTVQRPEVELELAPTWTSIEWPGADGVSIAGALHDEDIADKVLVVYHWDEATAAWLAFFPGLEDVPGLNTLTNLEQGRTYWIAVAGPLTWTVATP